MPYAKVETARDAGVPTTKNGVPLTLAQINKWAEIYDAVKKAGTAKEPAAVAWKTWEGLYKKEAGKFVRREASEPKEYVKICSCSKCGWKKEYPEGIEVPDRCPKCGGHLRVELTYKVPKKMAESFGCECLNCGAVISTGSVPYVGKHCRDIRCPKCGGPMRRVERPGIGAAELRDVSHPSMIKPLIFKKLLCKCSRCDWSKKCDPKETLPVKCPKCGAIVTCQTSGSEKFSYYKKKGKWFKRRMAEKISKEEIIKSIRQGRNDAFSYAHFVASNMADYTLMQSTIEDLAALYNISQFEAAEIVQALTH